MSARRDTMSKDITTKELLEKLARTVAPLSDAQLGAVAGGAREIVFSVDEGLTITVTNSTSGGRQDDCLD
jgi:hypothetical protein